MEIATEPLIGGQLASKVRLFGFHPQKAKESYKSSSGLVGKPQEARLRRTFFLSCVSLTLLLSHHCSFGCTSSQPHGVPSATAMDLERGRGGQATGVGNAHFRFDPVPACKFHQGNWSQKVWAKDIPCNHARNPNTAIVSPVHSPNPSTDLTTSVNTSGQ